MNTASPDLRPQRYRGWMPPAAGIAAAAVAFALPLVLVANPGSSGSATPSVQTQALQPVVIPAPAAMPSILPDTAAQEMTAAITRNDTVEVLRVAQIPGRLAVLEAAGSSPLISAILLDRPDIVRLLLSAGANPNAVLPIEGDALAGAPVLAAAVSRGSIEIVDLLLAKGANPNATGSYDGSVLADAMAEGRDDIVRLLRSHQAVLPATAASLVGAAAGGYEDEVRRLLAAGVPIDGGAGYKASTTALIAASTAGRAQTVRVLIEGRADLEKVDGSSSLTALGLAAERGHADIVALLISAKAALGGSDTGTLIEPPLHAAARAGQQDAVQALLAAGADAGASYQGSAAAEAAKQGNNDDLALVIENYGKSHSTPVRPLAVRQEAVKRDSTQRTTRAAAASTSEAPNVQPPAVRIESPPAEAPGAVAARLYAAGRYSEAFAGYRTLAEAGDRLAQGWLAWMYWRGQGIQADAFAARRWFESSAKAGVEGSQKNLADMLSRGEGGPKDSEAAKEWYTKAFAQYQYEAEKGDGMAENTVGNMYYEGHGPKKDRSQAAEWFRRSAEAGYAPGQRNYGLSLVDGDGVKKDLQEGIRWLQAAARQGDQPAQDKLKSLKVTP